MDRIRVEPPGDITLPEKGQTSLWSSVTREPWPTDSGRQADMSAAEMPAGAAPNLAPDWHSINWKAVYRNVRRLQARIVKAVREGRWIKSRLWFTCSPTRSVAGPWPFYESSATRVHGLRAWTESSGTRPKPSRLLSALCVGTVINRNRSAGCTFPRATANGAVSGFPR